MQKTLVEKIIINFKERYGTSPTPQQIKHFHSILKNQAKADYLRDLTIKVDL